MKEIRDKLEELALAYEGQLELYRRIQEVGSGEEELIRDGYLDRLLQVLRDKEALLKQAGEYELRIRCVQDELTTHFDLETFSLPQLEMHAPAYYQEELGRLKGSVAELLVVLEELEKQESRNEGSLNQYLEASRGPRTKKPQARLAGKAYGKK